MLRLLIENTLDREDNNMVEWIECKISDIGTVVGGATPSTKKAENYEGGNIAWITPKDLSTFSGRYIQRGERNITEIGLKSCSTQLLPENTVLFSSRAPIGYVAIAANEVCTNQGFKSVIPNKATDPLFLFYLLKYNKDKIEAMGSGTTFKEVSGNTMKNIIVRVPSDKEVQKNIASILGTLDDKIEENERINNNLEQQIEAILLSFIENTNSNNVKLGDYLYIKGRIGWKGLKKDEYLEHSDFRIINGESLTKAGIDWSKAGYISKSRYDESPEIMLKKGDILLSKDGTIGKIGYIDSLSAPTTVASGIFVIRNIQPEIISTTFIYFLLKSRLFTDFITARTEGSVIPHLYQKDFMQFEFPLPSKDEMASFEKLTAPMFSFIISNLNENDRLTRLRDSLLPRLMSGELDVSNISL